MFQEFTVFKIKGNYQQGQKGEEKSSKQNVFCFSVLMTLECCMSKNFVISFFVLLITAMVLMLYLFLFKCS